MIGEKNKALANLVLENLEVCSLDGDTNKDLNCGIAIPSVNKKLHKETDFPTCLPHIRTIALAFELYIALNGVYCSSEKGLPSIIINFSAKTDLTIGGNFTIVPTS